MFRQVGIAAIEPIDLDEEVYNFAVDEDESYVAEGIVNHNCRCWPATSPIVPLQAMNWRAGGPIIKSLFATFRPVITGENAMARQTSLLVLRELAGEQPRKHDLIKSLLAGDIPALPGEAMTVDADELVKSMAAAVTTAKATPGTDPNQVKSPAGKSGAGKPEQKLAGTTPDHLVMVAQQLLAKIRTTPPGSVEHTHLKEQYHHIREAIRATHKGKGLVGSTAPRGQAVKMAAPPSFIEGGAAKLQTPRQFEIAVAQCHTRDEAMELGHYFDAVMRRGNHAGPAWDEAWNEIKQAMKTMPGADGDASIQDKTAAPGKGGPAAVGPGGRPPLPGDKGYTEHFGARVDAAMKQGRESARAAGKKPHEAAHAALDMGKKEFLSEHKRLVGVLRDPKHADDLHEAKLQADEVKQKTGVDLAQPKPRKVATPIGQAMREARGNGKHAAAIAPPSKRRAK